MNGIEYCRRKIVFWESTPVAGPFDETKYPFIVKPMLRLDDITVKSMVVYGASQSFKSVFLELATAYRLDMYRCSVLAVSQTDDDADEFASQKLNPLLKRISSLTDSLKKGAYSQKIAQWLWPAHSLIISGPGQNAQNSKSVRFLHTDEAHLWCVAYPNALSALDGRMGDRWDRAALHCTTAATASTEIDILYHEGQQDEWHNRCIHCNKLIWLLWTDEAREHYNGEEVFHWKESLNEQEKINSIHVVCPHCHKEISADKRNRFAMDLGADYVRMNPNSADMNASYRWNAFAPAWKPWPDLFAKYLRAIEALKWGEMGPWEEWCKKYLVVSWRGQLPLIGDSVKGKQFRSADVPKVREELRTLSVDYQAGIGGEGKHWWALVEQWDKKGNSKRLRYDKLRSWDAVEALRITMEVECEHVGVDARHETRDVYAACSRYKWMAYMSTDETEFAHMTLRVGKQPITEQKPYSPARREDSQIGKHQADAKRQLPNGKYCPPGWAIVRSWSKPTLYAILYKLKSGYGGREYSIADDINIDFRKQINSYVPGYQTDKATQTVKKTIWVKTEKHDHGFVCSAQGLCIAILHAHFPLALDPAPVLQSTS